MAFKGVRKDGYIQVEMFTLDTLNINKIYYSVDLLSIYQHPIPRKKRHLI